MLSYIMQGNNDTTESIIAPPTSVRVLPSRRGNVTRVRWEHSPIVTAMLTGNTLQTCEDVESLLMECIQTHSNDRICQAAARQFALCIPMEDKQENRK